MSARERAVSSAVKGSRSKELLVVAAALGAGALQLLASVGTPVGAFEDDSLHLRIAHAVLAGARSRPFDLHDPVADVLPGLGLLLAVPVRLLEPHWALFRAAGLAFAAAAVFFTWRLGRRLLPENWALAAALLAALSPVSLAFAGAVLPDLPLMALCAALFDGLAGASGKGARPRARAFAWLIAGACLASLLRPQGGILAACVGLGILLESGAKRAALFLFASLLPLSCWFVFNHFAAGTFSSYYSSYWRSQVGALADPGFALVHAAQLLTALFADALLPVAGLPFAARFAAGLAGLGLAAAGLLRAWRRTREPWIFAAGAYLLLILALHLTWQPVEPRYVMPVLPLLLVFLLAAVSDLARGRRGLSAALLSAVAAAGFLSGAVQARSGSRQPAAFQPRTMEWLRERTPPDAVVESLEYNTVALLAQRDAVFPAAVAQRDVWLAAALARRVRYFHVVPAFRAVSMRPHPTAAFLPSRLPLWVRSSPYIKEIYSNPSEGAIVYRLDHPDAARFLRAWAAYGIACTAVRSGHFDFSRKELRKAVALEPELALAWAALGSLEPDRTERRKDFERAARADPTLEGIQRDLAAELAARRAR